MCRSIRYCLRIDCLSTHDFDRLNGKRDNTGPSSKGHVCVAGQGRHSRNRLRMPENDLGCLLNHAKRLRNGEVMTVGVSSFATKMMTLGPRQKATSAWQAGSTVGELD